MERPSSTSADALRQYMPGDMIHIGDSAAWKDILVEIHCRPREEKGMLIPAVAEPQIVWNISGTLQCQERDIGGEWLSHRVVPGDIFLTTSPAPYELRWKVLGPEPLIAMHVFLGLPLLARAAKALLRPEAKAPHLKELFAVRDPTLSTLLEQLRLELVERAPASELFVQGIAQSLAIHLIRTYRDEADTRAPRGSRLPEFQFRKVSTLMENALEEGISIGALANAVAMSESHFSRIFKATTSFAPSQYFIRMRMAKAQQLLRETTRSIIEIGLDVGYSNPSHFSQVFRKEAGVTPHDYRQENRA